MKSKRKMLLLGSLGTGALVAIVKMLVTDLWPEYLRPLVSTAWTWTLEVLTWFAQPVTFPLWSFIAVALVVLGVTGVLAYFVASLGVDLNAANAKLNPVLPPLDKNAQRVLTVIAQNGGKGEGLYLNDLPSMTGLTQLLYEAGMDALDHWNMFLISRSGWGNQITLSARGRAYILHPESPLAWVADSA